jgi:hypothetical protein
MVRTAQASGKKTKRRGQGGILKVLGDGTDDVHYIETISRRGYRFVTPVVETCEDGPSATRSLAVLPLANLPGDPYMTFSRTE